MLSALSYSKILREFNTYQRNTGQRHPLSLGIVELKRAVADEILNHPEDKDIWIVTISVGTSSVQFTVEFDTSTSDIIFLAMTAKALAMATFSMTHPLHLLPATLKSHSLLMNLVSGPHHWSTIFRYCHYCLSHCQQTDSLYC
jgi:hypothetical protein